MFRIPARLGQRLDEQGREPDGRSATHGHGVSPGEDGDGAVPLRDALRLHAAEVLAACLDAEVALHIARHGYSGIPGEAPLVVRNGFQPLRVLSTGIGPVDLRLPKVRARVPGVSAFRPVLGLRYVRRASSWRTGAAERYLHALAVGDWPRLMADLLALPGETPGLPIDRLEAAWTREHPGVAVRRNPMLGEGVIEIASFTLAPPAGVGESQEIAAVIARADAGPWCLLAAGAGAPGTIAGTLRDTLMNITLPLQRKQPA